MTTKKTTTTTTSTTPILTTATATIAKLTVTSTTTVIKTTANTAELRTKLFVNQTMRQLKNYNRLLDEKITTFKLQTALKTKRRMIFLLMMSDDSFEDYLKKALQRQNQVKKQSNVTSAFKMVVLVAMIGLLVGLIRTLYEMLRVIVITYEGHLKIYERVKKEKLKKKRQNKK